ncbi:ABC transporter ATP-binding protein [Compostimonas suwonensis]|uniref:Peptide/nickel transport system ATP-binding protein/oligopeptide transport system ATP-binding protein n=1 Tax=Compostimonas suwonensis TaxID=1048394 RepID=A0A2M9C0F3_9MICO|nr:ABC transporter ATP-binding protein [Compostimonas suwonensis]PJJ63816.1 peptide/nickel transport system ATP-binding protein/oligopeptide transport system ATP-binding protein [Compostimonas suwonensis]
MTDSAAVFRAPRAANGDEAALAVRGLSVEFVTRDGIVKAVQDVDLTVPVGKTLAVLGESGSGKSVTAQTIMGLLDSPPGRITAGEVWFEGVDLLSASPEVRREVSGEGLAMVFQDSLSALNPVYTVGGQLAELLRVRRGLSRRAAWDRAVELMAKVRIPAPERRAHDYPHQFSGGMRQRIMIALAIALEPRVLIADEATTALDVTVQAQIMELLTELQRENGMSLVLITHDLGVAAEVADDVVVMYAGRVVEYGSVRELFARPAHPYTRGLLRSVPRVDRQEATLWAIPGSPPNPLNLGVGCAFRTRCDVAIELCAVERPGLLALESAGTGSARVSACHRREEVLHAGA